MSATPEMKDALIRNLKLFNAKERDHLMRFAYLGQNEGYRADSAFLHPDFDKELKRLGECESYSCVFAGMDYHLDWLFAALWLAANKPDWQPVSGQHPMLPVEAIPSVEVNIDPAYFDFRPIMGNQEDIDLLALYADGQQLMLLLVEAKGSAAFDRVQLARKLIRLDRILASAGILDGSPSAVKYRLILASPIRPSFRDVDGSSLDCAGYAAGLPRPAASSDPESSAPVDKFEAMRTALGDCRSGVGKGLHHLELRGFPQDLLVLKQDGTMKRRATPHAARGKGKS